MKTVIILALTSALGMTACNSTSSNRSQDQNKMSSNDSTTTVHHENVPGVNAASFDAVVTAYLKIKDGLASDDGKAAAAGGDDFVAAIGRMNSSAMNADQKKVFDETADDAKEMAEHIGKSADRIGHQREHFEMLSGDLYDLAKVFKPQQTLYKDHCPMYNNGKGADWISEAKEIKNPYLGKKMPECGKVTEEIK